MIDIKNLVISTPSQEIVHGVDLHIDKAERVGLIGASGSGKSLIVQAILGILPPSMSVQGEIFVNSRNVLQMSDTERASMRGTVMSAVFQNPMTALNPMVTVEKNIELPLKMHYSLSRDERHSRVEEALTHVGLEREIMSRYPSQISGGQAQRVAIAEALIGHPQVLIADEPTTALDSIVQQGIINLLVQRTEHQGAAVLFTSHDFSVISRVAQRCYVINNGEIVEEGDLESIINSPHHDYTVQLIEAARDIAISGNDTVDSSRGE
ncbi:ABC transporter ATP-binding protein [Alloscardovia theropitheci]|uniref:ABC transporter ATP-binding protein n=1 Tax=Alloscardovia theropitheci TaxID=2496842 RepID=A0A4V2MU49_9BIFI|nr:ABC transporter ATP-binding protein [Alloscardovia theropitheci]TCD54979.1 ABC transporter ATP-binding protein [Alloscardovia theropitheci]